MSTPAYKKAARQREHARVKEKDLFDKKYGLGKYTVKRAKPAFVAYQPEPVYRRETPEIPSSNSIPSGSCTKQEPMKYTGERRLLGIATMHKSNMVPIFEDNKEEAVEIARMRR